jgi:hypothetical protein
MMSLNNELNLKPARRDGRPLYYDIAPGDRVQCYTCLLNGLDGQHGRGFGFMVDPANSPADDGQLYTICKGHIPDNAVIYDPGTDECRTKDGQNTWQEK